MKKSSAPDPDNNSHQHLVRSPYFFIVLSRLSVPHSSFSLHKGPTRNVIDDKRLKAPSSDVVINKYVWRVLVTEKMTSGRNECDLVAPIN